jgi:RNA polymerase sigma-32 factor
MNGKGVHMPSADLVKDIIKKNPVLSPSDQLDLVRKWQNNSSQAALDKLILSNMKIVSKEAFKLKSKNYYISYEDLMQEGIAGLLKAASMFDTSQEVTFLTYAMWWVKANMKRYVMDYKSVVKMGTTRDDRTLFSNLSKSLREAEEGGLSGEEMMDYISKSLSVKKGSLQQMIASLKGSDIRLDAPVKAGEEGSVSRIDLLKDASDHHRAFEDADELCSLTQAISEIMVTMPDMEREIIENRFLTETPKTLRDLEGEMNISREWVRRVEKRAIDRLKKRLRSAYGIEGFGD